MYGPFDYYRPKEANAVMLVEQGHFSSDVEALRRGTTAQSPKGDLQYTLLAIPNHPRALNTLVNLARRERTSHPKGMRYPVECYFDRAIRFRPNDGMVKMIFGNYLSAGGKLDEAKAMYVDAERTLSGRPNFHYNYGLLNVAMKEWDLAVDNAARAYAGGFDLPGLRNKLVGAGKWEAVVERINATRNSGAAP